MKKKIFLILAVSSLLSCEKIMFEDEINSNEPRVIYEYLWKQCDEKYSFFKYKNVNWNMVYETYSAMIYNEMTDDSLFNVLSNMLQELKDSHIAIASPFNVSQYDVRLTGPVNIDWRVIQENYLGTDFYITGSFTHDFIANGQVGYIRLSTFPGNATSFEMDYIIEKYRNTKGIIFDIRQNEGGAASDIFTILSRFTDREIHLFDSYIKSGPGHDEFSAPLSVYAKPSGKSQFIKKIIVLADRGTYSAGSYFTLSAKAIPNMVIIGDTTGGGLGMPNGGQLPNGWVYRFPVTKTLTPDGINYENGIPPDIYCILKNNDTNSGLDNVIERALIEIL